MLADIDENEAFALPIKPSQVILPGQLSLPPGTERYVVEGGGSVIVEVGTGDRVEVIDVEGCQPCEIVTLGEDLRSHEDVLDKKADRSADGFKAILSTKNANRDSSASRTKEALKKRGISLDNVKAIVLFGETSPAGDKADFIVQRPGVLAVAALGKDMDADLQNTSTPIDLLIHRSKIITPLKAKLPEPLANPCQDFRINTATAKSFTVKAGEYIQIIDVEGRQCSDFQAFSRRKLDAGNEQPLDATITRSLLGRTNPVPGLPAKAFDQEMEPLIEVIQDTCGRHDAFLTACNSRYYDDMGYPGHVNCTDNFNKSLNRMALALAPDGKRSIIFTTQTSTRKTRFILTNPGRGRVIMC